jgi:hypothetical protein
VTTPSSGGLTLWHLTFTGAGVPDASLDFAPGLNIAYGASNTGKSFTAKALNFMFGGSEALPGIEQRQDYDAARGAGRHLVPCGAGRPIPPVRWARARTPFW